MEVELPAWRLIAAGWVRREELETTWSLDDLFKGLAVLDQREAMEAAARAEK